MIFKYEEYIKEIENMGHELGCHSLYHKTLKNISIETFMAETIECKKIIERATNNLVLGYRAPFFSLSDDQLNTLSEIGFKYDSSYTKSKANKYYNNMKLTGFVNHKGIIYEKAITKFYEIEIPTLKLFKWHIPIAGGGFFRITPFWLFKIMLKFFYKNNDCYNFYFHPYEISDVIFHELKIMTFKDRIRFNYGRKKNLKKFLSLIKYLKGQKVTFSTIEKHIKNL
jgi:peptidoglycan/xylan/chitin deacetylase (PgdA/CDA1 family)